MAKKEKKEVTNYGSALGEDIGHRLEIVINKIISEFLEDYPCHFLQETGYNPITKKTSKKLLLYDEYGTGYDVDGIITNESMQPLVLLESKYIRYKKHNRDKGSWICNTNKSLRNRYKSIRAAIAILAGSWSKTSVAMIESADVSVILINFNTISDILQKYGIDFDWQEKNTPQISAAWYLYDKLSERKKMNIANKMADLVKDKLIGLLRDILDDTKPRKIKRLTVEVLSSWGETSHESFDKREDAINYLEEFDLDKVFDSRGFYSIFDQVEYDDE